MTRAFCIGIVKVKGVCGRKGSHGQYSGKKPFVLFLGINIGMLNCNSSTMPCGSHTSQILAQLKSVRSIVRRSTSPFLWPCLRLAIFFNITVQYGNTLFFLFKQSCRIQLWVSDRDFDFIGNIIVNLKGILWIWDSRWIAPSIGIYSHTHIFFYRNAFLLMKLSNQSSKFLSDQSPNCFTIEFEM